MKNKILFCLNLIFLFLVFAINCYATDITIMIDDEVLVTDVSPIIVNDRVLLPARSIFEYTGGEVFWDPDKREVYIVRDENSILLAIDETIAFVNEEKVTMDVPPQIYFDRTYLPVRFVAESLNMEVNWNDKTRTVIITSPIEKSEFKGTLDKVSLTEGKDFVKIKLSGIGDLDHSLIKLSDPKRYVYDIKDCKLNTSGEQKIISDGNYISAVRWSQFDETTTRVVVDLHKYYFYDYEVDGNDVYIIFDDLTPPKNPVINQNLSMTELAEEFEVTFTKLSEKAKDKLVIVDPGHGGSEVGTIGKYKGRDIYEKDINIKICEALNYFLEKSEVMTYMLREDDTYINIKQRPEIANEKEGYFYLCVHNNASENPETNGVQVYYSEETAKFDNMTNKEISQIYYDNIAKLGLKKSGIVDNPNYIVIYKSQMPAIIVENAFMSNEKDLELLMDDEFLVKLAAKICESTILTLNKAAR